MTTLDPRALSALKNNQRQLDMDGVEVGVSRQALDELIAAYETDAPLSQPQAGEPAAWLYDWTNEYGSTETSASTQKIISVNSKLARNHRHLYASLQPANPAQVTDAIRSIVEDALNSAIPEPWEVAEHATQRILAAIGAGGHPASSPITEGEPSDAEVWKPIETAPKDGSRFLALEGDRHFDCWFVSDQYEGCFWQDEADSEPAPTHWMPLPSAPLLAAKSKGGE